MKEIWKVLDNTNEDYLISNYGRVKSRRITGSKAYKTGKHKNDYRIIKPWIAKTGYLYITIRYCNTLKRYKKAIHQLVAELFIEKPDTNQKLEVNHIDSNRQNNRVDNLEWVTSRENTEHAIQQCRLIPWNNKRKPIIATNIETGESKYFISISKAEVYYGTRKITEVLKGRRKTAKGHTYRYA